MTKKKNSASQRNSNPLVPRLEELETWLLERRERIAEARIQRKESLRLPELALKARETIQHVAACKLREADLNIAQRQEAIESLELKLVIRRRQLTKINAQRDADATAVDEARVKVIVAKRRLKEEKQVWVRILRTKFGSGDYRRKRTQRKKLERRLERKRARAEQQPTEPLTASEIQWGMTPKDKLATERAAAATKEKTE